MGEAPFQKKPQYSALLHFNAVDNNTTPDSRQRPSNKTKISRSLFGGTGDETCLYSAPNLSFLHSDDERFDSLAAIEAVKDLAMPPHLRLPGRKMNEQVNGSLSLVFSPFSLSGWVSQFSMPRVFTINIATIGNMYKCKRFMLIEPSLA